MRIGSLKQSEIFAFLAALFLIGVVLSEHHRFESDRALQEENQRLEGKYQRLKKENQRLEEEKQALEKPPIITLSEEENEFRFKSDSATVPPAFVTALRQKTIPQLDQLSKEYHCDVIEIIGHTDSVPVSRRQSNIDYITHSTTASSRHGSNLDLGMLRAINVMKILKDAQTDGWDILPEIKYFIPYSAGQFVGLDKHLAWGEKPRDDRARRRIEIRLLRSK